MRGFINLKFKQKLFLSTINLAMCSFLSTNIAYSMNNTKPILEDSTNSQTDCSNSNSDDVISENIISDECDNPKTDDNNTSDTNDSELVKDESDIVVDTPPTYSIGDMRFETKKMKFNVGIYQEISLPERYSHKGIEAQEIIDLLEAIADKNLEEFRLCVNVEGKIAFIGDLHGNADAAYAYVKFLENYFDEGSLNAAIFLGDYADRGDCSLGVFKILAELKLKYWDKVFLLRGNHENVSMNKVHGFCKECNDIFPERRIDIIETVSKFYKSLPVIANCNNVILCMHGGLPRNDFLYDLELMIKGNLSEDSSICDDSPYSAIADLIWSDPGNLRGFWTRNYVRGGGIIFSEKYVNYVFKVLEENCNTSFNRIVRGHQFSDGLGVSCGGKVLTVFSSTNYCDDYNRGTMLLFDPCKNQFATIYLYEL